MPAREGKSKEKIKTHIAGEKLFKFYKEKYFPISEMYQITNPVYNRIHNRVWELVIEAMINDNYQVTLPSNMGYIGIRGSKRRVRVEDGKLINKLPVDWDATLKLWDEDEEAKEKKMLVRILNKHTNGFIYEFYWVKNKAKFKNRQFWKFRATRDNKLKLKAALMDKRRNIDFYNLTRYD